MFLLSVVVTSPCQSRTGIARSRNFLGSEVPVLVVPVVGAILPLVLAALLPGGHIIALFLVGLGISIMLVAIVSVALLALLLFSFLFDI